ncbi:hypothetical protein C4M81_01570 [Mycoplasmopsis pullorum]|uniref:family 1 glycosylhydrolase n=1 Tax=Mycoplasmopsis pullorum TaxID=48003 RepID=UPI0011193E3E|nr:family 1 glycosylhydrolase [Mycoplasmopsis pullorum]TNK84680.1 hypothetical protein C4M81_01570 [Mycoplasmopsis pullorum]
MNRNFLKNFLWSDYTAANQLEGAYNKDGKGLSLTDALTDGDVHKARKVTYIRDENGFYPNSQVINHYEFFKIKKIRVHFQIKHIE